MLVDEERLRVAVKIATIIMENWNKNKDWDVNDLYMILGEVLLRKAGVERETVYDEVVREILEVLEGANLFNQRKMSLEDVMIIIGLVNTTLIYLGVRTVVYEDLLDLNNLPQA